MMQNDNILMQKNDYNLKILEEWKNYMLDFDMVSKLRFADQSPLQMIGLRENISSVVAPNKGVDIVVVLVLNIGAEPLNHGGAVEPDNIESASLSTVGNEKPAPDEDGTTGAGALRFRRGGCCTGDIAGIGSGGILA